MFPEHCVVYRLLSFLFGIGFFVLLGFYAHKVKDCKYWRDQFMSKKSDNNVPPLVQTKRY